MPSRQALELGTIFLLVLLGIDYLLVNAKKEEYIAHICWATRHVLHTARPVDEGEEKRNLPTSTRPPGNPESLLLESWAGGLRYCCFIQGPKMNPNALPGRQYQ